MLSSLARSVCYLLVLYGVLAIGQPSLANEPLDNSKTPFTQNSIVEEEVLNAKNCQQSVANIKKGIPLLKRKLRKSNSRDHNQITKNIINAKLAELKTKSSIEDCLVSKGKQADGYLCMSKTTDLQQCVVPNESL